MRSEQQINGDQCTPDTATSSSIRLEGPILCLDTQTDFLNTVPGCKTWPYESRIFSQPCTQIKEI